MAEKVVKVLKTIYHLISDKASHYLDLHVHHCLLT